MTRGSESVAFIIIIGIIVGLLLIMAQSCERNPQLETNTKTTETGVEYKYFTIDGMPCVYVIVGYGRDRTGGPSCDWSKWKK